MDCTSWTKLSPCCREGPYLTPRTSGTRCALRSQGPHMAGTGALFVLQGHGRPIATVSRRTSRAPSLFHKQAQHDRRGAVRTPRLAFQFQHPTARLTRADADAAFRSQLSLSELPLLTSTPSTNCSRASLCSGSVTPSRSPQLAVLAGDGAESVPENQCIGLRFTFLSARCGISFFGL
jgi:hypothetical protein